MKEMIINTIEVLLVVILLAPIVWVMLVDINDIDTKEEEEE